MEKVAVICGYGDLGKKVAKKLSENGYVVPLISRNTSEKREDFFCCDINDSKQVDEVLRYIINKFGKIDAFIYLVATKIRRKNLLHLSNDEVKEDFETTVFGGFNILSKVAKIMKLRSAGTIIATTSAVVEQNTVYGTSMGAYPAAKYALKGILRQMAQELSPDGITVNAIAPGFMRTKLNNDIPERMDDFLRQKNAMKRMVTTDEVADLILFLCSDQARHLTGLSVPVTSADIFQL